ncbi:MAG: DUF4124 domain-containing protein, partial [Deltaproteobacteria bacterium]|nr:DUF4124 domain-containing protein [Deltaproteobacteria bacterium]
MKRGYVVFIAAMLYLSSPATSSAADILRWVDERGVVHYTDNLHNIPEKFKANATRTKMP